MKDYYRILEIPRDASQEAIRDRYRVLVLTWHPDRFTDPAEKSNAEERVKEINEAYEVLSDPGKRRRYDRERGGRGPRRPRRAETPPDWRDPLQPSPRDYLHKAVYGGRGDAVAVDIDRPANVLVLDEHNYARYRQGISFRYMGGFARGTPVVVRLPVPGRWHVVVDDGGTGRGVRAFFQIYRRG